jgi:hypothetical protein
MEKHLLSLTSSEILSLVKKLPFFDDMIELDVLVDGDFNISVHDSINCFMFNVVRIDLCRGHVLDHVRSSQKRWKIQSK